MTPTELAAKGRAIAGVADAHRWQTILAHKLKVNVTTVNRWATGRRPISPTTEVAIALLAKEAGQEGGNRHEEPLPDPVP